MIARFKDVTLGSQAKVLAVLAVPTAALIFGLFLGLRVAGLPMTRSGLDPGLFVSFLVALILAAIMLAFQLAALLVLRLLPWRGPRLHIRSEDGDSLRRVFE
jgi:hypothetical protein